MRDEEGEKWQRVFKSAHSKNQDLTEQLKKAQDYTTAMEDENMTIRAKMQ